MFQRSKEQLEGSRLSSVVDEVRMAFATSNDINKNLLKNLVIQQPINYKRKADVIPFQIPHKKLLEKIEFKKDLPEPLTGYLEKQVQIRAKWEQGSTDDDYSSRETSSSSRSSRKQRGQVKMVGLTFDDVSKKSRRSTVIDELIADQMALIEELRANKDGLFYYMTYAYPKSSERYSPYSLRVVPYSEVDKKNFLTISSHGVMQYYCSESSFTPLHKWETDYKMYCKLMEIKTFYNYRMWKAFYVWKKCLSWKKINSARKFLERNLFILNPLLKEALLNIQSMCLKLSDITYTNLAETENCYLFYFIEDQMTKLEVVVGKLHEFRNVVKELVSNASHGALLEQGFTVNDEELIMQKQATRRKKNETKMSYIDQANKRRFCVRISCFITLIDYMMINLFHSLLTNSVHELLALLQSHMTFMPENEKLEGTGLTEVLEEQRLPDDSIKAPLFITDVVLRTTGVTLDPPEQVVMDIFDQLLGLWTEHILKVRTFLSDPLYLPFLQPTINGKQEERLCGFGPPLSFYLKNDKVLEYTKLRIFENIKACYESANTYLQRFETIRQAYEEDVNLTFDEIKEEKETEKFKYWLTRLHQEQENIEQILAEQPLGLLHLHQDGIKTSFLPEITRLLTAIADVLPVIGKECVDVLIKETDDAVAYLDQKPHTSDEYVKYLDYISTALEKVDKLELNLEYAKELYDLMEEFLIFVPPEEMNNYLGVSVALGTLRNVVDTKAAETEDIVKQFAEQMNKDISLLISKIGKINDDCMLPWLIDIDSNKEEALSTLKGLYEQLLECQEEAAVFKANQKQFKLEVTRFDMLDEVINQVKLRSLMWESVDEWENTKKSWYTIDFQTLDVEEMNLFVAKNVKNITQLEKGLPKNAIVPKFKDDVEKIKEKMPVVSYLRNPALRQRHWAQIENVLDYKFKAEEMLTLQLLENLQVFSHAGELMEIAGTASSEAGLEAMLKKVEETWKWLEFPIVTYRDTKDVYILGGLEEVQTALDDSNVTISTIASSRNVGPIKTRVDEWMKTLLQFTQTLDEWISCQQNWIYLEQIFSAPDIQRQLPNEAKLFQVVDRTWKDIMRKTARNPLAIQACMVPNLLQSLKKNNGHLEQILKCLEAYLEIKRVAFPRFYFLSNEELLEILAQTRNPHAVQPHLRKCFDAIAKLEFGVRITEDDDESAASGDNTKTVMTNDIIAMISPEGERVQLGRGLKARGNVEDWLSKVEESMFITLRKKMKASIADFMEVPREEWFMNHPNQIVLAVSQIMWAKEVHAILDGNYSSTNKLAEMKKFEEINFQNLKNLARILRGDLDPLVRKILIALTTIDVHARDTVTSLVKKQVTSSDEFEWLKMLRYYWAEDIDNCVAKMSSASVVYNYEYLGAGGVLVITPLTDRCYLCLMGALQLDLGGAPAGPAGTGKTETTKDLAKALAMQCVVFNCSEGLDFKMMGRFFSGLAQSGAWCCFDEFNRIDIEVLSVIAQQLITIRNAKAAKVTRFMFEGREIKMNPKCAAFITMNPGYAGRTELPDNLKAMFRPISMMVPDYALIAEVTLYSEGFESSKELSQKMVQMYKLCSEQLSQQDHYDFGMRAVKSVLVMAGTLKRANPTLNEDVVLIRALRDSNLPKFLADDAILFQDIISDLFPGINIPEQDYGVLESGLQAAIAEMGLQPAACTILKSIQLYETMIVRWGVMLVGPTGGGKSTVLSVLRQALGKLFMDEVEGQYYRPVHTYILNPKAVTLGELFGEVHPLTLEWRDGLLGIMTRTAVQWPTPDHQWIICDGPVDAVWIENLNTVLDDNKMLCLANSERIKLTPQVHMVFEVQDLAQASPATVSRCGMVYIDSEELKWMPYVKTWLSRKAEEFGEDTTNYITNLFDKYVEKSLQFAKKNCEFDVNQVEISKIAMMCALIESILAKPNLYDANFALDRSRMHGLLAQIFAFAQLWAVGGNMNEKCREKLEVFLRDLLEDCPDARIPTSMDMWGMFINPQIKRLDSWSKIMPDFTYDPAVPFFEILVPTLDTTRAGYIMECLATIKKPVMFIGGTGVGKSVIAKSVLNILDGSGEFNTVTLNFSAQTTSTRIQEIIEFRLEKRKKNLLIPVGGKRLIVFVDDVNMPKLDTYGSQPPIELLRQYLDYGGMYDRQKLFWKDIENVLLVAACAPPGGGRNPLTPRFVRHFAMIRVPAPNELAMKTIFRAIINGFFADFSQTISDAGDQIVSAAVSIYERISEELLPTPAKSHYIFNLRDLSKCFQGILQADSGTMRDLGDMYRLFFHENLRVYHDRLISVEDKSYFYHLLREVCTHTYGNPVLQFEESGIITNPPLLLFGDMMHVGAARENRVYEEIKDMEKLKNILQENLDDYNLITAKEMKLIFFLDAVEHTVRLARILRAERGNGLLVGVGGMGKQSLSRLASHVNGYSCSQIQLTRGYDHAAFFEDLRQLYYNAGVKNENSVFLFTDNQIVKEEFLEDISNILNSGEVPNLFEADDYEKVILDMRDKAKECGVPDSREQIFAFFISRSRQNIHLSLCMSPVGNAFRQRCRMFPSLVNCCTIDWFETWPAEALMSVAQDFMKFAGNKKLVDALSTFCVTAHKNVEDMSKRFYNEMRRRYYTTPSSYLDLLKLYKNMLQERKDKVNKSRDKIVNGLQKLEQTNKEVVNMEKALLALEPELAAKSAEIEELFEHLVQEQAQADHVRSTVQRDEEAAKVKAAETQAFADEAQKDLQVALPAMEAATKALDSLNKNDINEIKAFQKPPKLVQFVMETICLLLGFKTDWNSAKIMLADAGFLKKLMEYDKEHIPDTLVKKLKPYIESKDFNPDTIATVSKACKSLCQWVRAIDTYAKVFRVVEPKRKRQEQAEREYNKVVNLLAEKQKQLVEVEAAIAALEAKFNAVNADKQLLEDEVQLTAARLSRSGRLMMALVDESVRWAGGVKEFDKQLSTVTGDVMISAACVAYLGAFTSVYRDELKEKWVNLCESLKIPSTSSYNLVQVLVDQYDVRVWNTCGLPRDRVSTENAVLVTKAGRFPLMIDPQDQANRWIRQLEANNELSVVKATDANIMRVLEKAVRLGHPVLLEEVEETIDPTFGSVLMKQTFIQGGRTLIRLGDVDIEYDKNFRFYLTTKMSNPHYLPEVCIQVTLVNFTVTPDGLEEQLLADIVRLEQPKLEKQRIDLVVRINNDKTQLANIEEKILKLLFQSEGNILDDEELIETLNESKETSEIITARLKETETTEKKINLAREKYRRVATLGSVLYFVVARLADIDPMYQYSLKFFSQIFTSVIETSPKSSTLEGRIDTLNKGTTLAVYTNVSRGLFERHKLVFSFMLCVDILIHHKEINEEQWNFLIRGPLFMKTELPKKPDVPTLSDASWLCAHYMKQQFPNFANLPQDVLAHIPMQIGEYKHTIAVVQNSPKAPKTDWNSTLTDFEKLMLFKCLQEEKLVFAVTEYVRIKLGKPYIESPEVSLSLLFHDISNVVPLVFVLRPGSDPFSAFQRYARKAGKLDKVQSISLGQGQGPAAEKLIENAKVNGEWVFLQNCHLATSWMIPMERIVQQIINSPDTVHADFRLFFSSMPTKSFPVSVLQNSVKVTNEPPKGLRANLKRAFIDVNTQFFEDNPLGFPWKSMVFGICMFHGIIQERKKFGPLGWNIIYEFNDTDKDVAYSTIKMFSTPNSITWDALTYLTGEITYGGRVTDYWDLRCLKVILDNFFSPESIKPNYKYSSSGIYYCPNHPKIEKYREFIDNLPIIEEPEIFGMHKNANIAFQQKETQNLIGTILESQPRTEVGTKEKSSDDIVSDLATLVIESLREKITSEDAFPGLFKKDLKDRMPSLTTVLLQEIDRYNKLLLIIHTSMQSLLKAIKGLVVMSENLEEVYKSFINNQVPRMWGAKSYPSTKSLGGWINDLVLRLDFVAMWQKSGPPASFWISGFYFPQGFLTGTLQTHARKYDLPINLLKFDFKTTEHLIDQIAIKKKHDADKKDLPDMYGNFAVPVDGVNIHGLFLESGSWDLKSGTLVDPKPGEMTFAMPMMQFIPQVTMPENDPRYLCPLYKTPARAGTLSTTGHSTNFVIACLLPSSKPQNYWILQGTALFSQVAD